MVFLTRNSLGFTLVFLQPITFISPDHRVYFVSPVSAGAVVDVGDGGGAQPTP